MQEYTFSCAAGDAYPVKGFLALQRWDTDKSEVAHWHPYRSQRGAVTGSKGVFAVIANVDTDNKIGVLNDALPAGDGTVTCDGSSFTIKKLLLIGGYHGELVNERIAVFVFRFDELDAVAWKHPLHKGWAPGKNGKTGNGKTYIQHSVTLRGNPHQVFSPMSFKGATPAAAFFKGFLDNSVRQLIQDPGMFNGCQILEEDANPGPKSHGNLHVIAQGLFKSFGWWDLPSAAAELERDDEPALIQRVYDLAGSAGSLPRNMENCDDHSRDNIPTEEDTPVECLYVKL